eukprot:scaffold143125_cov27-Tisochrysis_lutea.AAC.1
MSPEHRQHCYWTHMPGKTHARLLLTYCTAATHISRQILSSALNSASTALSSAWTAAWRVRGQRLGGVEQGMQQRLANSPQCLVSGFWGSSRARSSASLTYHSAWSAAWRGLAKHAAASCSLTVVRGQWLGGVQQSTQQRLAHARLHIVIGISKAYTNRAHQTGCFVTDRPMPGGACRYGRA